ncbi:hypothetical protein [Moorena sp. SIO4G3]|uniref:hypothetical protein n=1 Tax=Moorena sp. SIO4G3 TaxID=2607821 RepID=UPI001429CB51|nr:hypothetical protein [Moorena sp. SIO4G3]NEO78596.1 hypothetical protein [Moorena sp. SIO4G3]
MIKAALSAMQSASGGNPLFPCCIALLRFRLRNAPTHALQYKKFINQSTAGAHRHGNLIRRSRLAVGHAGRVRAASGFAQKRRLRRTVRAPIEFYPFTDNSNYRVFLNGTPYSLLSRFN